MAHLVAGTKDYPKGYALLADLEFSNQKANGHNKQARQVRKEITNGSQVRESGNTHSNMNSQPIYEAQNVRPPQSPPAVTTTHHSGQQGGATTTSLGNNLSELDNLLEDLNSAKRTNGSNGVAHTEHHVSRSPSHQTHSAPTRSSGSATKELDELMASLSDFKIQGGRQQRVPPQRHVDQVRTAPVQESSPGGGEPQYANPHKQQHTQHQAVTHKSGTNQLDSMLGSLQSDMTRHGVHTVPKGHCAACNKPIVGQVVTALGSTWHPEHFACAHCNDELGTQNFFEREGKPYCSRDYHYLFSPHCAYCNGPIVDKVVTALDRTWHPEHFFCAACGRSFGDDGFHEKDGKAYCRDDYLEMFAAKCAACNKAIMENYVTALSTHFHPECFVCTECKEKFETGNFYDHEGLPYCWIHYHAKRGSLCSGCGKPITGRCVSAMTKKFHPEHFVCAFCLKQLNKGTFREQNEKPYCHVCFSKLFG